jgi:diketogulonate reductase-like aldo/keto reductase
MTDNNQMSQAREVPVVPLPGDAQLPMVGLGTWKLTGYQAEAAVTAALAAGYRHLDTAVMYGNEAEIGSALAASGLGRDEVFLTTKIRPSDIGKEPAVLRKSLRALRTDYVDLWLVHWPPQRPQLVRQLWNEVRKLRDEGLARAIGVSNYDLTQIDDLIESTGEGPAVNQVRWSPARYDPDVLVGHKARGIVLEGYSPLKDTSLTDPVISQVAAAHGVSAAQVVLRWHIEHGIPVIPKSERPERIAANIDLFGFALTPAEVASIDELGAV